MGACLAYLKNRHSKEAAVGVTGDEVREVMWGKGGRGIGDQVTF